MSNLTTQRGAAVPVLYAMAQRPNGVSTVEGAAALGMEVLKVSVTLRPTDIGKRVTCKDVTEGRVKTRFFADPAVTLEAIDAQRAAAHRLAASARLKGKAGTKKGTKRPDVAARMLAKHAANRAAVSVRPARQPLPDLPRKPEFVPIITSETKVTICPAPLVDHRYQVPPGEKVWGCGFSRLSPGQYPEQATSAAARAVSL